MKTFKRLMTCVLAFCVLGTILIYADSAYNKYYKFIFDMENEKENSDPATKPSDGDEKYYVTTLSEYDGLPGTVFSHGGTMYCRSRPFSDKTSSKQYAYMLTFNSFTKKNALYYNNASNGTAIQFGHAYVLRAEADGGNWGWDELYQPVKWCP